MLRRLLLMKFVPINADLGLLCLRWITILAMVLKHGTEKLMTFSAVRDKMLAHHAYVQALGVTPSLACATFADGVCGILLLVGIATRWAALAVLVNLLVVWTVLEHVQFFGSGKDHAELVVAYIGAAATLLFTGAGRYSIDRIIVRKVS
jgi:putative oxidoreductase